MAQDSYRMRMYKRRLWQERARIVLIGGLIWVTAALIISIVVTAAR